MNRPSGRTRCLPEAFPDPNEKRPPSPGNVVFDENFVRDIEETPNEPVTTASDEDSMTTDPAETPSPRAGMSSPRRSG
jgi:hypothetical protein